MLDFGDIPFFLGTAVATDRRGDRMFEVTLARTRTGEDVADKLEVVLDFPAEAEVVFSLFCFARQIASAREHRARDTYLNSETKYSLSGHRNLFHTLVQFSEIYDP